MDSMGQHGTGVVEFWPTRRVLEVTGLSHSELYRRMDKGDFPRPEKYLGTGRNFWPSPKVIDWQRKQIGDEKYDEFEALL